VWVWAGEVGGDDPRRSADWHVVGEPGRVAGHRSHVVARGQSLAEELAAAPPVAAMMVSLMVSSLVEQVSGS
jgi:hypothetical protein